VLTPQAEDGRVRFFFVETAGVFAGNVVVRQDTFELFGLAAERKFKVYFAGLVSDVGESVVKDVEVRNINATFELVGLAAEFNVEPQLPARIGDDAFPIALFVCATVEVSRPVSEKVIKNSIFVSRRICCLLERFFLSCSA